MNPDDALAAGVRDEAAFRALAAARLQPLAEATPPVQPSCPASPGPPSRPASPGPPSRPAPPGHTGPSDFDLNPDLRWRLAEGATPRPAAVLVPIVARETLTLLLTQRTEHLTKHAGQIAFPGGTIDATDDGPVGAALRETHEEIGLPRNAIEPLGLLPSYRTGTGYLITPVVAIIQPPLTLVPNPAEVADVFEVPLGFLMDEANHRRHARTYDGIERYFHAMPYGERYIWGATAGIIKSMQIRLFS